MPTALRIGAGQASHLLPEFEALAYVKAPPWFNYAAKMRGAAGYYADGGEPKDGNFAAYTYLTSFRDHDGKDLKEALAAWKRSGPAYLATLEAPRYPFPIDRERARRGRLHYDRVCSSCHGSYEGAEPFSSGAGATTSSRASWTTRR